MKKKELERGWEKEGVYKGKLKKGKGKKSHSELWNVLEYGADAAIRQWMLCLLDSHITLVIVGWLRVQNTPHSSSSSSPTPLMKTLWVHPCARQPTNRVTILRLPAILGYPLTVIMCFFLRCHLQKNYYYFPIVNYKNLYTNWRNTC